jgi:AraC-like DNA-binding protein
MDQPDAPALVPSPTPASAASPTPPAATSRGSASYRLPRAILVSLRAAGVDIDGAARRAGLLPSSLGDRIDVAPARHFLTEVFGAVPETFGLTIGAQVRPELFGVVGFAVMSSATYGAALGRLARYKRMLSGDRIEIKPSGPITVVRIHLSDVEQPYARVKLDLELAFLVALGRALTGMMLQPEQVALRFSAPAYAATYGKLFGCPVVFDAPNDEVIFASADLGLPLLSENAELAAIFEAKSEAELAKMSAPASLGSLVRAELRRSMRGEPPDVGVIARALVTSERSLQRKLQQEGTTFQQLVDDVRLELARRYLERAEVECAEISYLLGFSHPNSFYRAFKRWTGMTPEEHRRKATSPAIRAPG